MKLFRMVLSLGAAALMVFVAHYTLGYDNFARKIAGDEVYFYVVLSTIGILLTLGLYWSYLSSALNVKNLIAAVSVSILLGIVAVPTTVFFADYGKDLQKRAIKSLEKSG